MLALSKYKYFDIFMFTRFLYLIVTYFTHAVVILSERYSYLEEE